MSANVISQVGAPKTPASRWIEGRSSFSFTDVGEPRTQNGCCKVDLRDDAHPPGQARPKPAPNGFLKRHREHRDGIVVAGVVPQVDGQHFRVAQVTADPFAGRLVCGSLSAA